MRLSQLCSTKQRRHLTGKGDICHTCGGEALIMGVANSDNSFAPWLSWFPCASKYSMYILYISPSLNPGKLPTVLGLAGAKRFLFASPMTRLSTVKPDCTPKKSFLCRPHTWHCQCKRYKNKRLTNLCTCDDGGSRMFVRR